jgi:hypothetical protein
MKYIQIIEKKNEVQFRGILLRANFKILLRDGDL